MSDPILSALQQIPSANPNLNNSIVPWADLSTIPGGQMTQDQFNFWQSLNPDLYGGFQWDNGQTYGSLLGADYSGFNPNQIMYSDGTGISVNSIDELNNKRKQKPYYGGPWQPSDWGQNIQLPDSNTPNNIPYNPRGNNNNNLDAINLDLLFQEGKPKPYQTSPLDQPNDPIYQSLIDAQQQLNDFYGYQNMQEPGVYHGTNADYWNNPSAWHQPGTPTIGRVVIPENAIQDPGLLYNYHGQKQGTNPYAGHDFRQGVIDRSNNLPNKYNTNNKSWQWYNGR